MCQTQTLTLKYIVVNKTDKGPDLLEHVCFVLFFPGACFNERGSSQLVVHTWGKNTAINN